MNALEWDPKGESEFVKREPNTSEELQKLVCWSRSVIYVRDNCTLDLMHKMWVVFVGWNGLDGLDEEEEQEWLPENCWDKEQVVGDDWKFHLVLIKFEIAYETCQWWFQSDNCICVGFESFLCVISTLSIPWRWRFYSHLIDWETETKKRWKGLAQQPGYLCFHRMRTWTSYRASLLSPSKWIPRMESLLRFHFEIFRVCSLIIYLLYFYCMPFTVLSNGPP